MFRSTKTLGNDRGLSCVFRQWKAKTHCATWHGYALGFKFIFAGEQLDETNWIVDFGPNGFGKIKEWLTYMFDHTVLVAEDDPHKQELLDFANKTGTMDVRIVPAAGCELTAKLVWEHAQRVIHTQTKGRCWVESVEVFEHGSNSAIYSHPQALTKAREVEELTLALEKSVQCDQLS